MRSRYLLLLRECPRPGSPPRFAATRSGALWALDCLRMRFANRTTGGGAARLPLCGERSGAALTAALIVALSFALCACCSSCKREDRGFRVSPPAADAVEVVKLSDLQAGGGPTDQPIDNEYEQNAYAMGEGQRLYNSYNCVGCHAHGGGGMGPPLIDEKWIYGSQPQQIFSTIVQGRPNGMPSFRGKIPNHQVWQLVAYVRSLGGLANKDAAPGRDDHMNGGPPPNSTPKTQPVNSNAPGPA
jgi:cytochrome c oxidase cbb3-type subunit 3